MDLRTAGVTGIRLDVLDGSWWIGVESGAPVIVGGETMMQMTV
jgi:hypothetical protein